VSELLAVGMTSSPVRAPTYLWRGYLSRRPEHLARCQARLREEGARSKGRVHNPSRVGHDDRERHNLSPEGPGPKAFRRNVRDACLTKRFQVPHNIINYDSKTNCSVWLEDYRLVCRVAREDDDLFIIQFLPIYLADMARA
jgi:hypothetical protein